MRLCGCVHTPSTPAVDRPIPPPHLRLSHAEKPPPTVIWGWTKRKTTTFPLRNVENLSGAVKNQKRSFYSPPPPLALARQKSKQRDSAKERILFVFRKNLALRVFGAVMCVYVAYRVKRLIVWRKTKMEVRSRCVVCLCFWMGNAVKSV